MTGDIRDKLRKQLGGAGVKALPGQRSRQLEDKGSGQPAAEEKAPTHMPVDVYLMTDGTNSMEPVIAAVKRGLGDIAQELLTPSDRGEISISVGYVGDHYCVVSAVEHFLIPNNIKPSTLQLAPASSVHHIYPLTSDLRKLEEIIDRIPRIQNSDDAEAYECGWLALAKRITGNTQRKGRKQVAVFFGDMIPHGLPEFKGGLTFESHGRRGSYTLTDLGCPSHVDPLIAWRALDAATDLALFVGCTEYGRDYATSRYKGYGVDALQRKIVETARGERNTSKFVPLQEIDDIPALIMAGTRLARYLERKKPP